MIQVPTPEFYHSLIQAYLGDEITCIKVNTKESYDYPFFFDYRIEALFLQNIFIWHYRDRETKEWRNEIKQWYGRGNVMQYCEPRHEFTYKVTEATIYRKECVFNQIVSTEELAIRPEMVAEIIARHARKYIYAGYAQEMVYKK